MARVRQVRRLAVRPVAGDRHPGSRVDVPGAQENRQPVRTASTAPPYSLNGLLLMIRSGGIRYRYRPVGVSGPRAVSFHVAGSAPRSAAILRMVSGPVPFPSWSSTSKMPMSGGIRIPTR